jgi:glucose 1-dehydrogenase
MNASTLTVPVATASGRLLGRKALVTGSSKGIGRGIAIRLAQEGADVVINYNSDPRGAEEALAQVQALGRRGAIVRANLGTVGEVRDLVAQSAEALGGLDVLVNNAGIEKHAPFWEVTENDFDAVLNVNLKGVFFAAQAFVQQCLAAGRPGKIINISSVHEDWPMPGNTAYCLAKGGMRMLTRTAGLELARHNILVVGVGPGAVATPINLGTMNDPAKLAQLDAAIPLGRMARPEEIASVVGFLAGEGASYLTATTIFADGGIMHSSVGL